MIDEKKLIEDLCNAMNEGVISTIDDVVGIIEQQPKVGEWIPCLDGNNLPIETESYCGTETEIVLVTVKDGETGETFVTDSYMLDDTWEVESNALYVTAWQPLPEPYKGE